MKRTVFIFLVVFSCAAYGQDLGRQVAINYSIGDSISPAERDHLKLFPSFTGFKWAVFYLAQDSIVNVKVGLQKENGTPSDSVLMNYCSLTSLHAMLIAADSSIVDSVRIELKDGTIVSGETFAETNDMIILKTAHLGLLKISKDEIKELTRRKRGPEGKYFGLAKDPNETRAFVMPTGNTLPAGKGYIGDYELFLLTGAVGVTDWLMLNAGTVLFPMPLKDEIINYGFKARLYHIPDKFSVAAGLQMFTPLSGSENVGLWYAVASYGNSDNIVSAAVARGFDHFGGTTTIFGLSGDARTGKHTKLLAETWIMGDGSGAIMMIGIRFFGGNLSGDIGLMYPIGRNVDLESPIGVPVVNIVYNF
jgi:hypothetical protein